MDGNKKRKMEPSSSTTQKSGQAVVNPASALPKPLTTLQIKWDFPDAAKIQLEKNKDTIQHLKIDFRTPHDPTFQFSKMKKMTTIEFYKSYDQVEARSHGRTKMDVMRGESKMDKLRTKEFYKPGDQNETSRKLKDDGPQQIILFGISDIKKVFPKWRKMIISLRDSEMLDYFRSPSNLFETVEDLEIESSVETFHESLPVWHKLFPKLKSLTLDASNERDEEGTEILKTIIKLWNGSTILESINLHMDWVQFKKLDQILTGLGKKDCEKLQDSLASKEDIPMKIKKYTLAGLTGLKNLKMTMCEVDRIDDYSPPTFKKHKFKLMALVIRRYLFNQLPELKVKLEYQPGGGHHHGGGKSTKFI